MIRIAVLRDNNPESSLKWEIACRKNKIDFLTINMLRNDWFDLINEYKPSFCLSRPPGDIQRNKAIFDEKIFFLQNFTSYKVYPGFLETYIYENKSALNWFLKTNNIPHPGTYVSSNRYEAFGIPESISFPVVAKTIIGAAGSGVNILNTKQEAGRYIKKVFSKGVRRRFGPNKKVGTPQTWMIKAIQSPGYFFDKMQQYLERHGDVQKGILIFQEYIPHSFEWRCVRIGASYFAYKKLKVGDKASGSKQFEYGAPPDELLNFTRDLCKKFDFQFMAIDIFLSDNKILVNEMQTLFGHKNPYICMVNGRPGRYYFECGKWIFEEGDFNENESYNLRLAEILKFYES